MLKFVAFLLLVTLVSSLDTYQKTKQFCIQATQTPESCHNEKNIFKRSIDTPLSDIFNKKSEITKDLIECSNDNQVIYVIKAIVSNANSSKCIDNNVIMDSKICVDETLPTLIASKGCNGLNKCELSVDKLFNNMCECSLQKYLEIKFECVDKESIDELSTSHRRDKRYIRTRPLAARNHKFSLLSKNTRHPQRNAYENRKLPSVPRFNARKAPRHNPRLGRGYKIRPQSSRRPRRLPGGRQRTVHPRQNFRKNPPPLENEPFVTASGYNFRNRPQLDSSIHTSSNSTFTENSNDEEVYNGAYSMSYNNGVSRQS